MTGLKTALEEAKKLTENYPEVIKKVAFIEAFRALYYGQSEERVSQKTPRVEKKKSKLRSKNGKQITSNLNRLISEDFFKEKRDTSQIIDKFAQLGVSLRPSSLTKQLLAFTQSGSLYRVKEKKGKRSVWFYFAPGLSKDLEMQ